MCTKATSGIERFRSDFYTLDPGTPPRSLTSPSPGPGLHNGRQWGICFPSLSQAAWIWTGSPHDVKESRDPLLGRLRNFIKSTKQG